MISKIREKTKGLLILPAKLFAALKIHPNVVSFLGIPLALIAAYFAYQLNFAFALLFALLAVSMDLIDGTVAKLLNKSSNFGNYFETMIDKFVEVILILPFVLFYPVVAFLAISFSLVESYAKPRVALVIIADNRDWPAIGEHGDRLLVYLGGLAISIFYPLIYGFAVMEIALCIIAVMTLAGSLQRIMYARKLIKEAEQKGTLLPYIKKGNERAQK